MIISESWDAALSRYMSLEFIKKVRNAAYSDSRVIYPPVEKVFSAFESTPYEDVCILLLGQDPYINENQANGLCFSVSEGVKAPPSLKNIFKELYDDTGRVRMRTELDDWAKNGVLLLNAVLTVAAGESNSHKKIGWSEITDAVIKALNDREEPVIFMLWGNFAKEKKRFITNSRHIVLERAHPSPLSARNGFLGTRPFSEAERIAGKVIFVGD